MAPSGVMSEVFPPTCFVPEVSVNLLYWPVTTVSGNLCDGSASTMTMTETSPGRANTIVTLNTTFTSPTVYINVEGTWGYSSAGTRYENRTRILLPQSSANVSSYCSRAMNYPGTLLPVDYANFNYPVPAKAYRCQPKCFTPSWSMHLTLSTMLIGAANGTTTSLYTTWGTDTASVAVLSWYPLQNNCSTIWDDYAPALSVPQELFAMRPQQEADSGGCWFIPNPNDLLYDPPTALTQAASAAGPSAPTAYPTSTTVAVQPVAAEPASSLTIPTPMATAPAPAPSGPAATSTDGSSLPAGTADASIQVFSGDNGSVSSEPSTVVPTSAQEIAPQTAPYSGQDVTLQESSTVLTQDATQASSSDPEFATEVAASTPSSGPGSVAHISGSSGAGVAYTSNHGQDPQQTAVLATALAGGVGAIIASIMGVTSGTGTLVAASPQSASGVEAGNSQDSSQHSTDPAATVLSLLSDTIGGDIATPNAENTFFSVALAPPSATGVGVVLTDTAGDLHTFSSYSAGDIVVGTATVPPGQTTSLSGIGAVIAGSFGVEVHGTILPYSILDPITTSPPVPAFTAVSTIVVLHGTNPIPLGSGVLLTPGGPEVTLGGETLSLAPSASYLVINHTLTQSPGYSATSPSDPVYTVADTTLTAHGIAPIPLASSLLLTPGGPEITLGAETLSLAPSGSYLVINRTITQSPQLSHPTPSAEMGQPPVNTLLGHTYTLDPSAGLRLPVGSTIVVLFAGGATTISGTTLSLDPQESFVVVDGVTKTLGATALGTQLRSTRSSGIVTQSLPSFVDGGSGVQGWSGRTTEVASVTSAGTPGAASGGQSWSGGTTEVASVTSAAGRATASSSAGAGAERLARAWKWTAGWGVFAIGVMDVLNV
ncbi:hypothetical protein LTR35_015990 [Friedmanniomyces endolithicus]|uniref:Uncharacterized protein n=1 Tax=Friedmanniomyces endolithicus TaxID=329885 RepID=A0AAN6F9F0_9PEZI|nr:hypothetical protein LTR35_015990 [Friedmanniomyces endolithicus]KAK0273752.1 hypothetical protein LTS00_015684 [Friedmanniomyces endolithicus]KAK0308271.1 hypothetical protein LTR82_015605 [Friedmanniomyces endolithicus]